MRAKIRGCLAVAVPLLLSISAAISADVDHRIADAAQRRDLPTVRKLIAARTGVNARQPDGASALAWAAHWDDIETADLLIRTGADVNAANDYGITPLSLACTNGSAAMVDKLLKAGANANATQLTGETALMTCARTGTLPAVQALLVREANPNAKENSREQTPLMWAAAERHPDVVRALIERGADFNARTTAGFTPLMFSAQQGDVDSARALIDAGANVNDASKDSLTPLLVASSSGQQAVSLLLLEKGADPSAADARGYTPLHYASANRGLSELLKALLAHKADPNVRLAKGEPGATPMFLAAGAGNVNAMRALAAAGADAKIPTKEGTTPLMVAAGVGRFEARTAAQNRSALEAVKLTFELGVDINAVGESKWTALHGAAYTGSDEIVKFLIENGAKSEVFDVFGQTPLSIAEAVVTEGLGENADVRPRRFRESTVNLLLAMGATPTERAGVKVVGSMAVKP